MVSSSRKTDTQGYYFQVLFFILLLWTFYMWLLLKLHTTILDKSSCNKILKLALLKCCVFLFERLWNATFWISKIEVCQYSFFLALPRHLILGGAMWQLTQFHVSTWGGQVGWFECCIRCKFCCNNIVQECSSCLHAWQHK